MKYLITGADGFVGQYLVETLLGMGCEVVACAMRDIDDLKSLMKSGLSIQYPDITDNEAISRVILEAKPDVIIHLAAQSFPRVSWEKPVLTMNVNLIGSLYIFEAIRKLITKPVTIVLGSSAEYAMNEEGRPITETDRLEPSSIYGVSKLAMDEVARLYAFRYDLPIIRVRPFFLIGPRKEHDFCSDIAREIVAMERGERTSISVGNLSNIRDFLDVRDGVDALILLSQKGLKGEVYNICSGNKFKLRDILDIYKSFSKTNVVEVVNESLLRNYDEAIKVGNPTKLKALGWNIKLDITKTIQDILEYWRNR